MYSIPDWLFRMNYFEHKIDKASKALKVINIYNSNHIKLHMKHDTTSKNILEQSKE